MKYIKSLVRKLNVIPYSEESRVKELFVPDFYRACYPDVASANIDPFLHYMQHGWREARNPSPAINTLWYLYNIEGAASSGLDPLTHMIRSGAAVSASFKPSKQAGIDWLFLASKNMLLPKLAREFAAEYAFILKSRLLNPAYYKSTYMGVYGDPIEHFIRIGWKSGLKPCPDFHTEWYLTVNADVRASGLNPLVHYVQFGAQEGRNPRPPVRPAIQIKGRDVNDGGQKARGSVGYQDYLGFIAGMKGDLNDRISHIEKQLGQKFSSVVKHTSRALHAFEPIAESSYIKQYFVSPVDIIHSMNMFFFTYCKPNGAKVRITLHAIMDSINKKVLLHEEVVSPEQIVDGHSYTIWTKTPLAVKDVILMLTVQVLTLEKGHCITVAGRHPSYKAICLPKFSANDDIIFALEFNLAPPRDAHKMFAFISGCPGDAFRYRCEHQAEAIENCGYSVDVFQPHDFPYERILKNYSIVVAHRVPDDDRFRRFIDAAEKSGVIVVYDVDDLVFDPGRVSQIDAYNLMNLNEKEIYLQGVKRYNAAMARCQFVTVSTEKLQRAVKELFPKKIVHVIRNKVSQVMVEAAAVAMEERRTANSDAITMAYFSGSKTHSKDFCACAEAVAFIMNKYSWARLVIVGHLEPPASLKQFSERIEYIPFMPWINLPKVYGMIDINLAPLEYNNEFTEAKSELKYLEAALMKVPTIASDLGAFRIAMKNDALGFLCADEKEWRYHLSRLVEDRELRQRLGNAAYDHVMRSATTYSASNELQDSWRKLCSSKMDKQGRLRASVAFVTRAPIAQTGGGYKKIFILAKHLHSLGYDVRVHVEAIAHLANMSDEEIITFCSTNFDVDASIIRVGHSRIGPVDLAIATNWPTAPVVAKLHNARFRAYFIQDFEPQFYDPKSMEYRSADRTYDERLAFITIGDYLAKRLAPRKKWITAIPFAIDERFLRAGRKRVADKSGSRSRQLTILFFARPAIERRNFAAGVRALQRLSEAYKKLLRIQLYGLDEKLDLPFDYEDLGKLSQDELAEGMASADIHLSFSLTNISTVIYEAMACGCACVEADTEGVREMVRDGVDCILGDPSDGAFEALQTLIADESLRRRIAKEGYGFAQGLTDKKMCEAFENFIRQSCIMK